MQRVEYQIDGNTQRGWLIRICDWDEDYQQYSALIQAEDGSIVSVDRQDVRILDQPLIGRRVEFEYEWRRKKHQLKGVIRLIHGLQAVIEVEGEFGPFVVVGLVNLDPAIKPVS